MKLLRDTWLIFERYVQILMSNPTWIVIGVVQPLLYLLLFAPLLKPLASMRGFPAGGAYNVFIPGLLIQLGLFGAAGVGFSLIAELRQGVIERFRVTPVSRFALLLGRGLRDILTLVVQSMILVLLAVPFGLKVHPVGLVIALGLVALIGLAISSIAYTLALWLRSEDSYAPLIFTASLPLLLLSGVLLPLSLAPDWLKRIADANPLSYAVTAARAVFNNDMGNPDIVKALVIMGVLAVFSIALAGRAFSRAVA
jgi:ABC-2 type transport system permease protein